MVFVSLESIATNIKVRLGKTVSYEFTSYKIKEKSKNISYFKDQ
jgi:hypothetical protein